MNKLLLLFALLSVTMMPMASAAPTRRLKGASSSSSTDEAGSADDEPRSRKFDSGPRERECKVSSKDDEVKFSCKSGDSRKGSSGSGDAAVVDVDEPQTRGISLDPGMIRDKIQYKVRTNNKEGGVSVKVEYKQKYEEDDDEDFFTDTTTEFEINFNSMIEYAKPEDNESDSVQDEAYDWDADEILQTINLEEFDDISVVRNDGDDVVSYFSVSSSDQLINFNFTISRADFSEKITANNMKIDVRIVDFPWTRNDTYIALLSTVNSGMKIEMNYDEEAVAAGDESDGKKKHKETNQIQMDFNDATENFGFVPLGAYTWEDLAEVNTASDANLDAGNSPVLVDDNGEPADVEVVATSRSGNGANATEAPEDTTTIRVVATSPEALGNETFQTIAYSFVGSNAHEASDIYWDPEAGIFYDSAAFSMSWFASVLGGVVVSGMLLVAF